HEGADTYYQFCTAFPVGTALAQSWDPELLTRVGRAVSREMDEFQVDLWLAPGMNIQRNPLCGRNFEYYSEDPLLTGTLAAAITAGVQESGRHGVTLKHFACNNQEDNRMAVDARVPERTLREIYLRGFEIAVKTAAPAAVMSAYNCINGVHAANSRDLCTVVLRQEWGFAGLVMSDWNTTVPDDGSEPWRCAAAGNDVIMPGNPHDDADIRAALADGRLAETDVRACAGRLIALAAALRRR
ncbi:MAG TPA: beta-glucosidase, partial [Candidatus Gemmiger avistercoris]|nr:beta-glucosidase [Candidatus Gemmiger avistercoris]